MVGKNKTKARRRHGDETSAAGRRHNTTNLGLANVEVLVAVVDDVALRSARPDETQTLK